MGDPGVSIWCWVLIKGGVSKTPLQKCSRGVGEICGGHYLEWITCRCVWILIFVTLMEPRDVSL